LISETSVTVWTRSPPRRSMSRERNFREMSAAREQTDRQTIAGNRAPPTGYAHTVSPMILWAATGSFQPGSPYWQGHSSPEGTPASLYG